MRFTYVAVLIFCLSAVSNGASSVSTGEAQARPVVAIRQATARSHRASGGLPRYPKLAEAAGVDGLMLVDTVIGIDGRVMSANLLFSIPMLDATTLDAIHAWRFEPFTRDGQPLVSRTVFAVRFQRFGPVVESEAFDALADAMLLCVMNLDRALFEPAVKECEAARNEATFSIQARTRASGLLNDARFAHENFSRAEQLHTDGRALAAAGRHAEAIRAFQDADQRLRRIHGRMSPASTAREGIARALTVLGSDYASSLEADGRTRDADRVRARLKSLPR